MCIQWPGLMWFGHDLVYTHSVFLPRLVNISGAIYMCVLYVCILCVSAYVCLYISVEDYHYFATEYDPFLEIDIIA